MTEVWFWQTIISPHMAGLACALAEAGCRVTYVAEVDMTADREQLGWAAPSTEGVAVRLIRAASEVGRHVADAAAGSIHLCQGIRGNGLIATAQRSLATRGLVQWVIMETVDDSGPTGLIKRLWYAALFRRDRARLTGVLCTGHKTADWVIARGVPAASVFPFAYFLADRSPAQTPCEDGPFRFLFAGQLIKRKRVDLLIRSLGMLRPSGADFELTIVGSGPLEAELRTLADTILPGRVQWVGALPADRVHSTMAVADCLVLPSRHDGWGAVVSEALMVGTPVICSDSCGAAGVVHASGVGGVFERDDTSHLVKLLEDIYRKGRRPPESRMALVQWAAALGARAGAQYLSAIFDHVKGSAPRPVAPWAKG